MSRVALSILIPTYNRCHRLERSLDELFVILNKLNLSEKIEVVVSDNGSDDQTIDVIKKYNSIFSNVGVLFKFAISEVNLGFDVNLAKCVKISSGEYLWFLSDDDNIIGEPFQKIFGDIKKYRPSAIVYNFNQTPYDYSNPLITVNHHCSYFKESVNQGLAKVLVWPKLTALIIRRDIDCLDMVEEIALDNPGFMHVALLIQCLIKYQGGILQKKDFIAEPDQDYMNNIDFMPNIGDNIVELYSKIMQKNNINLKEYAIKLAKRNTADVAIDCIYWLSEYYRGRMSFKINILNDIRAYIFHYLREIKLSSLPALIRPLSYYLYCRSINCFFYIACGVKLNKVRK